MNLLARCLAAIRRSRQLTQLELAARLSVSDAYISALETGRKRRPSDAFLERFEHELELNPNERFTLRMAVTASRNAIRIPRSASLDELELASVFAAALGHLHPDQMVLIRQILGLRLAMPRDVAARECPQEAAM